MSANSYDTSGIDLGYHYDPTIATTRAEFMAKTVRADSSEANNTLSFQDMLMLMVTQLQNQTIDNTADTNDMMNQIIQMTVMQAITEMSTKMEDVAEANILSYSASLVGQTVTVGVFDNKGVLASEVVGEVTATGTYNGQRVIFIGDECYPLSQIMAVGRLPDQKVPETGGAAGGTTGTDGTGETGGTDEIEPEPTLPPDTGTDENGSGTDAADDTVEKALG